MIFIRFKENFTYYYFTVFVNYDSSAKGKADIKEAKVNRHCRFINYFGYRSR